MKLTFNTLCLKLGFFYTKKKKLITKDGEITKLRRFNTFTRKPISDKL